MPKICGSQYDANPSASRLAGVGNDVVDRAVRGVATEDADAHVPTPQSIGAEATGTARRTGTGGGGAR